MTGRCKAKDKKNCSYYILLFCDSICFHQRMVSYSETKTEQLRDYIFNSAWQVRKGRAGGGLLKGNTVIINFCLTFHEIQCLPIITDFMSHGENRLNQMNVILSLFAVGAAGSVTHLVTDCLATVYQ